MPSDKTLDVGHLHAELRDVRLPIGLNLSHVKLAGQGIHLEKDPFLIEVGKPGTLEVTILEADLEQFLTAKAPSNVKDFKIRLEDGVVQVQATATMIMQIKAKAICTLRIVDKKQIFVDLQDVDMLGVGAKGIVQNQLDQINPVLDVADLPLNAEIEEVEIRAGAAIIRGKLTPKPA